MDSAANSQVPNCSTANLAEWMLLMLMMLMMVTNHADIDDFYHVDADNHYHADVDSIAVSLFVYDLVEFDK